MTYGYKEYEEILRLLFKYNIVLTDKVYEDYVKDLTKIFKI